MPCPSVYANDLLPASCSRQDPDPALDGNLFDIGDSDMISNLSVIDPSLDVRRLTDWRAFAKSG
jgi:hypothetical protein